MVEIESSAPVHWTQTGSFVKVNAYGQFEFFWKYINF